MKFRKNQNRTANTITRRNGSLALRNLSAHTLRSIQGGNNLDPRLLVVTDGLPPTDED